MAKKYQLFDEVLINSDITDFNNFMSKGTYQIFSSVTYSNGPGYTAGLLQVIPLGDAIIQIFIRYNGMTFVRLNWYGDWNSSWTQLSN